MENNYQKTTVIIESNGILFTEQWQTLAKNNLSLIHISTNASTEDTYSSGCWEGKHGRIAYNKVQNNIISYMKKLSDDNLEVFAPDVSMVINKDTAHDVREFVKKSLEQRLRFCTFYFDYTENNMDEAEFGYPATSRPALEELMKLERVLAKKFFISFRLWIPLKEAEQLQSKVDAMDLRVLEAEYADLLALAKNRSMRAEYEERQRIRAQRGKKTFTWDEDWTPTIRQTEIGGKTVCAAPFNMLDLYPNGVAECCGWITPRIALKDWVRDGAIDWDSLYNSPKMERIRLDMLNDEFGLCMKCCPLNPKYNETCSPHKYGYDRREP